MFIKRKCSNFAHKSIRLALKEKGGKSVVPVVNENVDTQVQPQAEAKKASKKKNTTEE